MPPDRALPLPIVPDALAGLFELEGALFLTLRNALVPGAAGVPIPGVVIEDVFEAYLRVLDAFPEGTPEFVEEREDELHGVLLLVGPDGGNVAYVAEVEVAEADRVLLGAFSDALGHAADPSPGPGYEPLAEAPAKIGRECDYQWVPEGDAATIADWARRALSPVLHSPFEGPQGAADHELLSELLRIAGDWENYIKVDQNDEAAVGRVAVSMLRAALGDGLGAAPTA
ncbi:hypothetical protein ACFXPY_06980 [Streptomyces sp. NPDC059153]|uniref:hypothetical protein n=1 Tax=Streptomyces sp. NPDC059153 TaxID=3346743 RepID=UPI0036C2159F